VVRGRNPDRAVAAARPDQALDAVMSKRRRKRAKQRSCISDGWAQTRSEK
jgi:hypothetical protein